MWCGLPAHKSKVLLLPESQSWGISSLSIQPRFQGSNPPPPGLSFQHRDFLPRVKMHSWLKFCRSHNQVFTLPVLWLREKILFRAWKKLLTLKTGFKLLINLNLLFRLLLATLPYGRHVSHLPHAVFRWLLWLMPATHSLRPGFPESDMGVPEQVTYWRILIVLYKNEERRLGQGKKANKGTISSGDEL